MMKNVRIFMKIMFTLQLQTDHFPSFTFIISNTLFQLTIDSNLSTRICWAMYMYIHVAVDNDIDGWMDYQFKFYAQELNCNTSSLERGINMSLFEVQQQELQIVMEKIESNFELKKQIKLINYNPKSNNLTSKQIFIKFERISLLKVSQRAQQNKMHNTASPTICLNCHKTSDSNVILKCDHELCLHCAQVIKTLQNQNPLDIKYRIVCPFCRMNTITLNIGNLISQQQQKLVFVNMQESQLSERQFQKNGLQSAIEENMKISKLKEMSYNDRIAAIFTDRKTPDLQLQTAKRCSVDSNNRQRGSRSRQGYQNGNDSFDITCPEHKQEIIIFYCREQNCLLCMQCMYKHMKEHKNHNVSSIKDAIQQIEKQNMKFKHQSKQLIEQAQSLLLICKSNKSKLQQAYLFLQQMIKKQFKELQILLRNKQKEMNDFLEKTFQKKNQEIKSRFEQLNQTKSVLTDYYRYQTNSFYQNIYFFSNFQQVKDSLKYSPIAAKIKQFKDQDLLCFHRNATTKEFQTLIDKLFVPKIDGRQSGQRSRATSRGNFQKNLKTDQLKQIPQETIKLAKRKMKQINRKIDSSRDFKKDKKYDFLQNLQIGEPASTKKVQKQEKGSSLNRKPLNAWTPTPQLEKAPGKKTSISKK